jgi:hypothetical protein
MRNWGIVVTAFYALALMGLLVPGVLLLGGWLDVSDVLSGLLDFYGSSLRSWLAWTWVVILVGGQALLLFLSVDTSRRKLKPRQHILVSISTAAILFALLAVAAICALVAGVGGDDTPAWGLVDSELKALGWLLALWLLWGLAFYLYARGTPERAARVLAWLFRGSVLELLIAVPAHVIVRQREDCSAPAVTSFGIVTGLAVMLLSFGPSILFLYKKRLERYRQRPA